MNDTKDEAVILLSGGMDSTTAVYEAMERGYRPHLLHTSYGQETETKEQESAKALADKIDEATFYQVETNHLAQIGASSLTEEGMDVPDVDRGDSEIPNSYVPFRNANLLAMAVSYAEANECKAVFIGAHSEDFSGYPDCRPTFFDAFQEMVNLGTKPETDIEIVAPFADWSKTEIVERGIKLDVPFELTWSCYRDEGPACGTCEACAYRLQAFQNVGKQDPLEYKERPTYEN